MKMNKNFRLLIASAILAASLMILFYSNSDAQVMDNHLESVINEFRDVWS